MEAGRPLDALIAEKVMGWTLKGPDHGIAPDDREVATKYGPDASWEVPRYSTEVADAWALVEHIRRGAQWLWSLEDSGQSGWIVQLIPSPANTRSPLVHAESAALPHAICVAALIAHDSAEEGR